MTHGRPLPLAGQGCAQPGGLRRSNVGRSPRPSPRAAAEKAMMNQVARAWRWGRGGGRARRSRRPALLLLALIGESRGMARLIRAIEERFSGA